MGQVAGSSTNAVASISQMWQKMQ